MNQTFWNRLLVISKIVLCLSTTSLCIVIGYDLHHISSSPTAKQVYALTRDMRLTVDNVNKAAIDERMFYERQVPIYDTQIQNSLFKLNMILSDVDKSVLATQMPIQHLDDSILSAKLAIDTIPPVTTSAKKAVDDLDIVVTNPNIPKAIDQGLQATTQLKEASAHVNKTTEVIQKVAEPYAHCGFFCRVYHKLF